MYAVRLRVYVRVYVKKNLNPGNVQDKNPKGRRCRVWVATESVCFGFDLSRRRF